MYCVPNVSLIRLRIWSLLLLAWIFLSQRSTWPRSAGVFNFDSIYIYVNHNCTSSLSPGGLRTSFVAATTQAQILVDSCAAQKHFGAANRHWIDIFYNNDGPDRLSAQNNIESETPHDRFRNGGMCANHKTTQSHSSWLGHSAFTRVNKIYCRKERPRLTFTQQHTALSLPSNTKPYSVVKHTFGQTWQAIFYRQKKTEDIQLAPRFNG